MANARRLKNQINKISLNEVPIDDPDVIENAFIQYFSNLYSSPPNPRRRVKGLEWETISSMEAEILERSFSEEEVHLVILEMDGEKSLGPDAFTMAFYKSC